MSSSERPEPARLEALARRQLSDFRARKPGTAFAGPVDLSVEDAYRVQDEVARLRESDGEMRAGYKVGCTGPAIKQIFGMSGPVRGIVWAGEVALSPATVRASGFANLSIEGELGVRLGPGAKPAELFVHIELHHYVLRSTPRRLAELIANNALHGGVVVGDAVGWERRPGSARIRVFVDDILRDEGDAYEVDPEASIGWLRERVELEAGQLILTGTPIGIIPVAAGSKVRVEADGIGSATLAVID